MLWPILVYLWLTLHLLTAFEELPLFNQLELQYPGYPAYGGSVSSDQVWEWVVGSEYEQQRPHNTAALRLSWMLNRYAGRHSLGSHPIHVPGLGLVSISGEDGLQYIVNNTAYGPWLAVKYGNPLVLPLSRFHGSSRHKLHHFLRGKMGIVRLVSYHKDHPGGHIGLWKCDHWVQSRDFTREHSLLVVELWETPDSVCPKREWVPPAKLVPPDGILQAGYVIKGVARRKVFENWPEVGPKTLQKTDKRQHSRHLHRDQGSTNGADLSYPQLQPD